MVRNLLGEARVLGDEDRHRVGVAGHDEHQVVAPVLHLLDQGVDGFGPVLVAGQAVRLVDEQHPTRRRGDDLGGLHRGLPEVAGHQLGPVDLDQLAFAEQAEGAVDAAHQRATVVLPVPGLPTNTRCRVMVGEARPGLGPQRLDPQDRHLAVDLRLHLLQAVSASSSASSSSSDLGSGRLAP